MEHWLKIILGILGFIFALSIYAGVISGNGIIWGFWMFFWILILIVIVAVALAFIAWAVLRFIMLIKVFSRQKR
jgi:hypothetical protein